MGFGPVSSQKLEGLIENVNTALAVLGTSNALVYPKLCFVDDGSLTEGNLLGEVVGLVDNGDGTKGEKVRYPFSPVSNAPKAWPAGKPRGEVDEVIQYIEVVRNRQAPDDVLIYHDFQDAWGILNAKLPAIIDRAGLLWDLKLVEALHANRVGFDGKAMFAADHPIDPNDPAKGTQTNIVSIAAMDEPGLSSALDVYASIKWFDGITRNTQMDKPVLLVPTASLNTKARQLIFGSLIPSSGNGSTATGSNALEGMCSDVIFSPLLNDGTTDSTKFCYLVSPGTPVKAGLICSPTRPPLFHISGLDPNEEVRRKYGAYAYGWDAFGAVECGLYHDVVRIKVG